MLQELGDFELEWSYRYVPVAAHQVGNADVNIRFYQLVRERADANTYFGFSSRQKRKRHRKTTTISYTATYCRQHFQLVENGDPVLAVGKNHPYYMQSIVLLQQINKAKMKFTLLTVAAALSSASAFTAAVSDLKRRIVTNRGTIDESLANDAFRNKSLLTDPFCSPRILVKLLL
jgi:hypothetical protein